MRISALVAGAVLAMGLAACSDSSPDVTTVEASPVTGTYALKSIDGQALPWTDTAHNMTLISSAFSINADGTWDDANAYLDGTTGKDHGTVTVSGSTATFTLGGKTYQATVSNGTFSLSFAGHVGVYQSF